MLIVLCPPYSVRARFFLSDLISLFFKIFIGEAPVEHWGAAGPPVTVRHFWGGYFIMYTASPSLPPLPKSPQLPVLATFSSRR